MSVFEYRALDSVGRNKSGTISADNAKRARQQLRDSGLFPVKLESQAGQKRHDTGITHHRQRLNDSDLSILTRQFSVLLGSGLTMEDCFNALIKQEQHHKIRSMVSKIKESVMQGHPLATALQQFPRTFSELYISSVAAGELTGKLPEVMDRLAGHIEDRLGISQKIGTALVYPVILILVSIAVIGALMSFVVPKVVSVFNKTGQDLPWLTQQLIWVSDIVERYGAAIVIFLGVVGVMSMLLFRQDKPRFWLHSTFLRLPGIGRITCATNSSRMANTLAIMLGSGVPMLAALDASGKVINNLRIRKDMLQATTEVAEGASLHRALGRSPNFPALMVQMIESGEASGKLAMMLDKAASVIEREIEARLAIIVSLFEPIMILFMGLVVMLIVLAILLPIFDLNQIMG